MRLLVVGGTGLLGRAVAAEARARGHDVRAPGSRELDLRRHLPPLGADTVVNCAYVRRGPDLRTVTVEGPVALAAACGAAGARLVQLSTDLVFAGRPEPYTPADPPDPVDGYGRAKAEMEQRVLATLPDALVVRTSLLWAGHEPGPQERLVLDACAGAPVTFFVNEVRCPIEVGELARRLVDEVEAPAHGRPPRHGIVHEAGAEALDRLTFARRVARHLGLDPDLLRGATPPPGSPERPGRVVLVA
jgi:dTDP-4-dehydrorhamnose reductase